MSSSDERREMAVWVSKVLDREVNCYDSEILFFTFKAIIKELTRFDESIDRLWDRVIYGDGDR